MSFKIDTSQIDELAALLAGAAPRMEKDTTRVIDMVTDAVVSSVKAGVPRDTNELADSVEVDRSGGLGYRVRYIHADPKQGYFLEYGSPTTGAPIPWLSGPAQQGSMLLHSELMRVADPL